VNKSVIPVSNAPARSGVRSFLVSDVCGPEASLQNQLFVLEAFFPAPAGGLARFLRAIGLIRLALLLAASLMADTFKLGERHGRVGFDLGPRCFLGPNRS
jgi:hypothetical protein